MTDLESARLRGQNLFLQEEKLRAERRIDDLLTVLRGMQLRLAAADAQLRTVREQQDATADGVFARLIASFRQPPQTAPAVAKEKTHASSDRDQDAQRVRSRPVLR